MKNINFLSFLFLFLFFFDVPGFTQGKKRLDTDYLNIEVNGYKTSYLDFGTNNIKSVDVGGDEGTILFEIQSGTNILKLKSSENKIFPVVNMLVALEDTVVLFNISYNANLTSTYTKITLENPEAKSSQDSSKDFENEPGSSAITAPSSNASSTDLDEKFNALLNAKKEIGVSSMRERMYLILENIGVDDNYLYLKFKMRNATAIDFRLGYMNFEVKHKAKKLNVSTQQSTFPEYKIYSGNPKVIKSKEEQYLLFRLNKIALTKDEVLIFKLVEDLADTKGRTVELDIRNVHFRKVTHL